MHPATPATSNIIPVNDNLSLILCLDQDIPPTSCPGQVPAGWHLTNEVLPFSIEGVWVEAYLIEKAS